MFFKRGDLELRYIILLLIGLVVLLTVLYLFRSQTSLFIDTIFNLNKQINATRPPLDVLVGG